MSRIIAKRASIGILIGIDVQAFDLAMKHRIHNCSGLAQVPPALGSRYKVSILVRPHTLRHACGYKLAWAYRVMATFVGGAQADQ
jgi:hypothetical protein